MAAGWSPWPGDGGRGVQGVGGGEPGLPGHLVDPRLVGPQGSEAGLARVLQAEGGDPDQLGAAGDRVRAGIPAVDVDDDMGRASAIVDRDGAVGADGHDHAVGPGLAGPEVEVPRRWSRLPAWV